jgi:hypothetical protein
MSACPSLIKNTPASMGKGTVISVVELPLMKIGSANLRKTKSDLYAGRWIGSIGANSISRSSVLQ